MLTWLRLLPLLLLLTSSADSGTGASEGEASDGATASSEAETSSADTEVDVDDDPDADDATDGSTTQVTGTSFERGFNNLLERFGNNARRVAEHLYRQDYKHRENLRLARGEVDQLKQTLPKNGAKFVDKRTVQELDSYRKLGKPADVQARLDAGQKAQQALTGREKDDQLRDVAEVTGWNYKALKGAAADLDYAVKEVEENGAKKRQAFVVTRNGNEAKEILATEWFQANKDFLLPALTAGGGQGGQTTHSYGQQFIQQPVHQQRSNGSQQQQSAAAAVLSRYEDPKPQK